MMTNQDTMDENLYKDVEVTEVEKENFYKSVLSDKPFGLDFSIFDNQFKLTLRALYTAENQDILYWLDKERDSGLLTTSDIYYMRMMNFRLAVSLQTLNDTPFAPELTRETEPIVKDGKSNYLLSRVNILEKWPAFKLVAFQSVYKDFELKVMKLTASIKTPGFWKASA